ncbi:hypothetical protein [Priestia megaterium]|uniref:hypothetical protein n=1 Tax=Priestia megaterium TaxID=1404 RepID=UPI002E9E74F3|nr:hypothetical protein [Priestia megaterium]
MPKATGNIQLHRKKHKSERNLVGDYRSYLEEIMTHFKQEEEEELDREFLSYVRDDLMQEFALNSAEAEEMIQKSVIMKLIKENPDYVYHYDAEYWAKSIFTSQMSQHSVT